MFRFKRSIPVDYDTQGHIYFTSRRYRKLTGAEQAQIRRLCREAGGEYHRALLRFVTTDMGAAAVCDRYYLSQSTLERIVRKYYVAFAGMMETKDL